MNSHFALLNTRSSLRACFRTHLFIRSRVRWGITLLLSFILLLLTSSRGRAGERDEWLNHMRSIEPQGYLCHYTDTPIQVDGKLDETAWDDAPWTRFFVDIEGIAKPAPRFHTRAKLLWDDNYLYIAAELEEPHVWATLTQHDSVIFRDPDFEVFIDPDGDTHQYYEFEMNALNTGWDLRLDKPYQDEGKPHDEWDIPGLKTAVQVRGTINKAADTDKGWTVELAFPWTVLAEHARHAGPPTEGEQWRIDFSRVEWLITTNGGQYQKVPNKPEDNWVWSEQGVVDMHRPEMWGRLQFTRQPPEKEIVVAPLPGKAARDLALEVYHAQRDFWGANHRWATNVTELGWQTNAATAGLPVIESTVDGYVCSVTFKEGDLDRVWRIRQDRLLKLDESMPVESETFVAEAARSYGELGRRAAWFLVDNMPAGDRGRLSCDFLMENLKLALEARQRFPWAKAVDERIFFNDVLPYASLDEPRDRWRVDFLRIASELVHDCKTAGEAAQVLNRDIFNRVGVHYNTARKRNNQSPKESIEQGKATCTGLAIILVDACRAVGVPARIVGVPQWAQKEGNHTWVEIWDGEWFFTGADEYDKNGFNRAWFNGDASLTARSANPLNGVYASSWRRTGEYFPLAWQLDSREVPGINVSARYAVLVPSTNASGRVVHVRLREAANGNRLPADVELRTMGGVVVGRDHTRAGTADLNDMPDFRLPEEAVSVIFRFVRDGQSREHVLSCAACQPSQTLDFVWSELAPVSENILAGENWFSRPAGERGQPSAMGLTKVEAQRLAAMAWADLGKTRAESAAAELSAKSIQIGDKTLKWMEKTYGDAPNGKRSLWITMHGGGQATEEENDRNWHGYFGRYELPPGSINIAPRAPANTWDMWFVKWVDPLFDRLIADMVLNRGVDPNRVYLLGYSAGGDGVYQLAPRMADRFAGAAMMAGHPNDSLPDSLRNLPFFLYMGGDDSAYNRNQVIRAYSAKLDVLQAADPQGYAHRMTLYPGLAHNMQNRESEVIPRLAPLTRSSWPKRVVWKQDDNPAHTRFYWLARSPKETRSNPVYAAHIEGQTITVESPASGDLTFRLSDALVDLDQSIRVVVSGRTVFDGKVARTFESIVQSLRDREDPETVAQATLTISW